MEKKFANEYVKYVFSEGEKKLIAAEMAQQVADLNQKEDDKKAIMSDLKSQIDRLQAEVNNAATNLNNGYEMRSIKCEHVPDYKRGVWKVTRTDNFEVIKERPMSEADLQRSLDGME